MADYSKAHICQCLNRLFNRRRNSVVTIAGNRQKTGEQFVEGVASVAHGLLQLGIGNGDIVAICAFNSDWYLEWLLAVAFVGGIVAPLNYRWSFKDAESAMLMVRPVMLVTDESSNHWYSELQSNAIPSLRWHVFLGSSTDFIKASNVLTAETLRKDNIKSLPSNYYWAPNGAVMICFTSGTTGRPKGVIISHSALIVQSLAKIAIIGYSEDDVYLHTAPLCHIGGLSSAIAMLMVGACHVLIPKFEATLSVHAIEQHRVTSLITVPAIMVDLISLTRMRETWKGRQYVKKILNGGGSLSVELTKDVTKLFPKAKLVSAYGMTETCSSLTFMTLYDPILEDPTQIWQIFGKTKSNLVHQQHGVCVGKPAPHIDIKISANDSSDIGRILTRGPHMMLAYWDQNPAKDTSNEVWFDTGDIGSIDDYGNLWLIGRTNGRIKSGGENVYPEEVEEILLQHPGVIATVVVGIPDARFTETVVACIKLRESWQWLDDNGIPFAESERFLCSEILQNHCRDKNLSRFKIPKIFMFWRKPFPVTSTGKIRRDQVRRQVVFHLQSLPSNL